MDEEKSELGYSSQSILDVAKRIDQFIADNGWNWCMMDLVYRILKTIHL